jgi:hypothetical protein
VKAKRVERQPADGAAVPRLVAAAKSGRLVVFAGAGISVEPPTALPSWWDLNAAAVRAIAAPLNPASFWFDPSLIPNGRT